MCDFTSGSGLVSSDSVHNSLKTSQFSKTLCRQAARTVQRVGHNVRKPGQSGAMVVFNVSKSASHFGENFSSLEISYVVSRVFPKSFIPFTVSPTAS